MTNVTSGDEARFCLGRDPTCTAINPCLACHEHVVLTCVLPAMRDGGYAATEGQVKAFSRRYREGMKATLRAAKQEDPAAFARSVQVRRAMLERSWNDARAHGLPEPAYPFAVVAVEASTPTQSGPAPDFAGPAEQGGVSSHGGMPAERSGVPPHGGMPTGAPMAGGIPIGVPLGPVGRGSSDVAPPRAPRAAGGAPMAGGIPIGVPLGPIGGDSGGGGGMPDEPDWPGRGGDDGDGEKELPLARGDARRIVKNGTRRSATSATSTKGASAVEPGANGAVVDAPDAATPPGGDS